MTETLLERRHRLLGDATLFYDNPVHIVRGEGVWVWDADAHRYLDCYNNVPHVGHCHPKVVEAICRQAGTLNTHTRYLHEGILNYAERLTGTFADTLNSVIMVCTGSEANDIALRMAEAMTGKRGIIATDHTYHGNTATVAALSTTNAPGTGQNDWVAHVPAPDSYRGADPTTFAAHVRNAIAQLEAGPHGFAGIILCPFFANEGFPDLPPGFLDETVRAVRESGGIVIADEVQPGFGRIGTYFWGHAFQGFTPDVVTLGKPMGNGHPVAAVVTSAEVLGRFRDTFRYFNTFGGNPVACAAAMAVMDVLEEEGLQQQAAEVGEYALSIFGQLADRHGCIGNVRGKGMFFGAELVADRADKTPDPDLTLQAVNALRERGILLNRLGLHYNTLKIRPNLQFTKENADQLADAVDCVLGALAR